MSESRVSDASAPTLRDGARLAALLVVVGGTLRLAGWHLHALLTPWSDLRSYFLPKYQYAADRIAAGELPLWNPLEFAGIPFLATLQPGVLYPPIRVVYALLSGQHAYDTLFVSHLVLAAVATLWLARRLGLGPWPSAFAGLWVMQPTWLISLYDHPASVFGVAWVPMLALLARRAVQRPTARTAILLGVCAAVQVVSGYPPFCLATGYLLALGVPVWLLEARAYPGGVRLGSAAATIGGAIAVAGLLAAVQLVPSLELLSSTARAAESLSMQAGLEHLAPSLMSIMNFPQMTFGASVTKAWNLYGPAFLGLGVLGLVLPGRRLVAWWGLLGFVLCALLPYPWYRALPGYAMVRFGQEWPVTAPLFAHLLAAAGLDAVVCRLHASSRTTALVTLVALAVTSGWNCQQVAPRWSVAKAGFGATPVPAWVEEACPLDQDRWRAYWPSAQPRAGLFRAGVPSVGGYEQSLLPRRTATLAAALGVGNGATPGTWARQLAAAGGLASRSALRCLLAGRAAPVGEASFARMRVDGGRALWVSSRAQPRARLAYETIVAASADDALVLAERAPPNVVVVEDRDLPRLAGCARSSDGTVTLRTVRPEDLRLDVSSPCPAYLVLADTWYPGWTATIDGRPTTIHRADYAFRAILVPEGRHEVRFRYAPRSVRVGGALFLLGLLICVVVLLAGVRGRASRSDPVRAA